jgi:hypothetical protein
VYAGGRFSAAGGTTASNIAKWNGTGWSALGTGTDAFGTVLAVAVDGNSNVFIGGTFLTAGPVTARQVARWDGTTWSTLGSGLAGTVQALAANGNSNLYAGGTFLTVGDASKVTAFFGNYNPALVSSTKMLASQLVAQVSMFPNPTTKHITIELPAALARRPVLVTIVDGNGRMMREHTIATNLTSYTLDTDGLPKAGYTVLLKTADGVISRRLIIR